MKKFLTVLLALSVVFTYSFSAVGTAFAADDPEAQALGYAQTAGGSKVGLLAAQDTTHSGSAVEYAKTETTKIATYNVAKDLIAALKASEPEFTYENFKVDYDKWLEGDPSDAPTYIGTKDSDPSEKWNMEYAKGSIAEYFEAKADEKEFDGRIADARKALDAYKPEMYSTKTYTVGNVDYTYRSYAEKLIKEANEALSAITDTSTIETGDGEDSNTDYKDAINGILYGFKFTVGTGDIAVNKIYTSEDKIKDLPKADAADVVAGVIGKLNTLLTVEDEPADDDKDQVDLEHAKADFTYYAKVTFFNRVKATAEDDVTTRTGGYQYNTAKKEVAGVKVANPKNITKAEAAAINAAILNDLTDTIEVVDVYLENQSKPEDAKNALKTDSDFEANVIKKALTAKDLYATAEKTAARMKDAVDFNGAKKYADADVDAALAKDKVDIYSNFNAAVFTAKDYLDQVARLTDDVDVARKAAIAKFKDNMVLTGADKTAEADKKYCKDFYADVNDVYADYAVIKAETLDALDDAKTVEEINSIMAKADASLAELRTKEEATTSLTKAIDKYTEALEKYATEQCNLLNNKVTTIGEVDIYRVASFLDQTDDDVTTSALEDGMDLLQKVKNEAALPAAYEAAKALFKNIKTDADLKTEAANVTKLLGALTAVPASDLSNEDKYLEAYDAYQAYLEQYGAAKSDIEGSLMFDLKMADLKEYQINAIKAAIDELPSAIDLGDKEAVEAIRTQLEKYLAVYDVNSATYDGEDDAYGKVFDITSIAYGTLTDAENVIWSDEIGVVTKQIMKLTEKSTVAEMKAAADAYDALSGSQQQAVRDELGQAFMYKLEMVLKAKIDAVKSFKIKTTTQRYTGKKMRVNWTVTAGDESAIDGYRIYFSTKKTNSGYKYLAKTSKKYINHTSIKKNVKKGTRVFYRVRAYAEIDGVRYFSDYSTVGNRIWK